MLLHIPGVLTPAQVKSMRVQLDTAAWIDGRASVGSQGAQVKRNRQLPEGSPLALELGGQVSSALMAHPLFVSSVLPLRVLAPFFNRYAGAAAGDDQGNEQYGAHVDGAIRMQRSGPPVRTDVSCTVFLSEPDEYEGGELSISDAYGTHEVKLPAGDAIVYPSTSVHEVLPVTRGERLASFLWVQSMVRDDWKRAMLYELDTNIQALRARHGEEAELVGLTGHYHNLLRMWAET
jgi:PKHD-type hydroxylase